MRIAQLCYLYRPALGGVETHVENISRYLVEFGNKVDVYTSDFSSLSCEERISPLEDHIDGVYIHRKHGIPIRHKSFYGQKLMFPSLAKDLFSQKFDIIHCHSIPSNHYTLAWLFSRLKRTPLFITAHYSPGDLDKIPDSMFGSIYWNTWMKFSLKRISKVIAIVQSEKERYIRYWGIPKTRIEVIPNGVNVEEMDRISESEVQSFQNKNGLQGRKVILFVGRITFLKGVDILVKAAAGLLKTYDNLILLLVGPVQDQDYFKSIKDLINSLKIEDKVQFMQLSRKDLVCAFHTANVVVLPSRGEVFGITLVEGMACKKVVIGSDSGGIPELIEDKKTGFLFKTEDPDDLRDKLDFVLKRKSSLDEIREQAYKSVVEKYNWKKIAQQLNQLYEQAL